MGISDHMLESRACPTVLNKTRIEAASKVTREFYQDLVELTSPMVRLDIYTSGRLRDDMGRS